jgi:hypothetical protein
MLMNRKLLNLTLVGLVGCALIAPLSGCDGDTAQSKPTIDTSTPFKTPDAPTVNKVEVKQKK